MALGALAIGGGLSTIGGGLGAIGGSAIAGSLIGKNFDKKGLIQGNSNWDKWRSLIRAFDGTITQDEMIKGKGLIQNLFGAKAAEKEEVKPTPETPEVNDTNQTEEPTEEQEQNGVMFDKAYMEEMLAKQWAREDAIRKETQEREDSAMQRWVEDAKKAGINPNLAIGMKGAESGGGITSATGLDYGGYSAEIQKYTAELNAEIEKGEGNKDRINSIIEKIISAAAMVGMAFISKGKAKK